MAKKNWKAIKKFLIEEFDEEIEELEDLHVAS
jgi:hypothetical protein